MIKEENNLSYFIGASNIRIKIIILLKKIIRL